MPRRSVVDGNPVAKSRIVANRHTLAAGAAEGTRRGSTTAGPPPVT